jgi:hypothetical protein
MANLDATKLTLYAISGLPRQDLFAQKAVPYMIEGPGFPGTLAITKQVLYAVSALENLLAMTKGVMYIVTTEPSGYKGLVMECMDRPIANVIAECHDRPESVAEACRVRPTDGWFSNGQPFPRG